MEGDPMTLDGHFVFEPMYSTTITQEVTVRAGRQVGKSNTAIAGPLILRSAAIPYHRSLCVLPLQMQADQLSSQYFKPMIEDSPIRAMLRDDSRSGSVRRRVFTNRSSITFLYAYQNAERIRGNPTDVLGIDEAQDMDTDHMPVIVACLDACLTPQTLITGTSKTKDTLLEDKWSASSQAIWHIKCSACGFDNRCCLEDGHILSMIGKHRDDISEKRPGTVCHGCLAPVNPRYGRWVPRYPERTGKLGFHIPQLLIPTHYANKDKWGILLERQRNYSPGRFLNEVLGEPYDFAVKLVSDSDLKNGSTDNLNNIEVALERRKKYEHVILSVDWGGGGQEGGSCTKLAVIGWNPEGKCDVIFGFQFPPSTDEVEEVRYVVSVASHLGCYFIVHDFNGGGSVREAVLTHLNWPRERIIPIIYNYEPDAPIIEYKKPKDFRARGFVHLDKSRSLQYNCFAIRSGAITFFKYDYVSPENPGMLHDFTTLVEDPISSPNGSTYYRIRKLKKESTDDFAQAVNMGCSYLWETMCGGQWPSLLTNYSLLDLRNQSRNLLSLEQMAAASQKSQGKTQL